MIVLNRRMGQSIVILDENVCTITLNAIDPAGATISLTENSAESKTRATTLPRGEPVEAFPGILVEFLQPLDGQPGARLGLLVPPGVNVFRKENWDANHK